MNKDTETFCPMEVFGIDSIIESFDSREGVFQTPKPLTSYDDNLVFVIGLAHSKNLDSIRNEISLLTRTLNDEDGIQDLGTDSESLIPLPSSFFEEMDKTNMIKVYGQGNRQIWIVSRVLLSSSKKDLNKAESMVLEFKDYIKRLRNIQYQTKLFPSENKEIFKLYEELPEDEETGEDDGDAKEIDTHQDNDSTRRISTSTRIYIPRFDAGAPDFVTIKLKDLDMIEHALTEYHFLMLQFEEMLISILEDSRLEFWRDEEA